MLNLSDKDLDRLSQEAAQEHDPGDIVGPRSWEKLEIRLDRDLGKINPNPARGIRRLPYYYAPAMLVLLGVSYYFIKVNNKAQKGATSGSPPLTAIQPAAPNALNPSSSTQKPEHPDKSTSTLALPPNTAPYPTTPDDRPDSLAAGPANHATTATRHPAGHAAAAAAPAGQPADHIAINQPADHQATSPGADHITAFGSTASGSTASGSTAFGSTADRTTHRQNHRNRHNLPKDQATATTDKPNDKPTGDLAAIGSTPTSANPTAASANPTAATKSQPARDLVFSSVRGPFALKRPIIIDDSALRAFTAKSSPPRLTIKKGGLHINRSLQLGVLVAPDFSSVNSVAGDRPGSSIGLTVDYQFANRWYIGTGLLISRKNYAAAPQDYHAPESWLRSNNINNLDYVKGSFSMLEIPLNLRYDFSTTGNTLFFVSAGASSYVSTSENCSYYYNHFGSQWVKAFQYPGRPGYLFSAIDLSAGVETGISNSLSLLIAPYMKLPSRNIGFGQVELSSFGINFALKFAPVLSRKR